MGYILHAYINVRSSCTNRGKGSLHLIHAVPSQDLLFDMCWFGPFIEEGGLYNAKKKSWGLSAVELAYERGIDGGSIIKDVKLAVWQCERREPCGNKSE